MKNKGGENETADPTKPKEAAKEPEAEETKA
jgi:hypothetical protein